MRGSLIALCVGSFFVAGLAQAASPPQQPESGPGGSDYKVLEVVKRGIGTASAGTFVFHAAGEPATPRPVVVFFHSWGAVNPALYGGWIEHLARKGNLVLYPRFQDVNRSRPADASALAANLIKASLAALADDAQAKPDLTRVAFIGHLAGVRHRAQPRDGCRELRDSRAEAGLRADARRHRQQREGEGHPAAGSLHHSRRYPAHHHERRSRSSAGRQGIPQDLGRGERCSGEPEALHARRFRRSRLSGPDGHPRIAGRSESGL